MKPTGGGQVNRTIHVFSASGTKLPARVDRGGEQSPGFPELTV